MQRRFELVNNWETGTEGGQAGPPWGDGLVLQVRARDVDGCANDSVSNEDNGEVAECFFNSSS